MTKPHSHIAVAFADIVGSSRLYATLGNERAKAKIDDALNAMDAVVTQHRGEVVKRIGDELMFTHPDAEAAAATAIGMNKALNERHFYLRTGMSFGPVLADGDDVYGDTVNRAAFLANTAHASQILLDKETLAGLGALGTQCEFFDRIHMKGQKEESQIYRLNWELQSTTSLDATVVEAPALGIENGIATRAVIDSQGQKFVLNPGELLVIGRDSASVDIALNHKGASRRHCTLAYRRGKFVLSDHSTNGTYLQQIGQPEVFLRRESTTLVANGCISIGQSVTQGENLLRYTLE